MLYMRKTKKTVKPFLKKRKFQKKSLLERRIVKLENKTKDVLNKEYLRHDFFNDMRSLTGNIFAYAINVPSLCNVPFQTVTATNNLYMSNMGVRITFSAERTALVTSTYVTYFIVRSKSALTPYLGSTGDIQLTQGVTHIHAQDGLLTQGITPCPFLNKDFFSILAFKRFCIGNQVFTGAGPTNLIDTHREYYHRLNLKIKLRAPNGNAFDLQENDIPTKDRIYIIIATDRPAGTLPANQPPIYINGQCMTKVLYN